MGRFFTLIKGYTVSNIESICAFVFILSLCLSGIADTRGTYSGALVLLTGWMGPLGGIYAWYANPLLVLSLIKAQDNASLSRLFAVVGFLIALTALMVKEIPYADGYAKVLHLGVGYYIWLLCFLLAFFSSTVKRTKQ